MKQLGLLLVFFGCSMGGYYFVRRESQRILRVEAILLLVREIRRSIAFMMTPLDEIYRRYVSDTLQGCGFLEILQKKGLRAAYEDKKDCFLFDSFTENRFLSFADNLGKHPAEEEIRSCDDMEDLISHVLEEAKKAYPAKRKLYSALGISLGIGAVILLL